MSTSLSLVLVERLNYYGYTPSNDLKIRFEDKKGKIDSRAVGYYTTMYKIYNEITKDQLCCSASHVSFFEYRFGVKEIVRLHVVSKLFKDIVSKFNGDITFYVSLAKKKTHYMSFTHDDYGTVAKIMGKEFIQDFNTTDAMVSYVRSKDKPTYCITPPPICVESKVLCHAQCLSKELKLSGELRFDDFIYLKVNELLIDRLYPLIKHLGYIRLSSIFSSRNIGAHISVITSREINNLHYYDKMHVGECFDKRGIFGFTFEITGFQEVVPPNWRGIKKVAMLDVESGDLEKFRKTAGFDKLLDNKHGFHLTLGVIRE